MSDKQTLQSQITQLKSVLASPKTDGTTRKILENGLKKAEAKLEELEKAEKLESSKKELTPKQEAKVEEVKKETKSLAQTLKEKVAKAKEKIATTTPKATKKGGARSVAKAKDLAKQRRSTQKKQSLADKDVESDANRYAINKTKRRSQGGRANQYGTKAENKGGIYYEKRENRYDVQNKRYAKLEDGGMMAKGGYSDFGYHVINDEVTLKNGKKVFITKGRYYFANELGDNKPSGVYYLTNNEDFIYVDEIKFPLNKMADGGSIQTINGTEFSTEDLSGMFAKGGETYGEGGGLRFREGYYAVGEPIFNSASNKWGQDFYYLGNKYVQKEKIFNNSLKELNEELQKDGIRRISKQDLKMHMDMVEKRISKDKIEYAKGGITEHGLMVGDMIVGTSSDPYSIVVRNNGMESVVDLNEGTRVSNNQGTRFASRSMKDPMVVRTQFEEMEFEYADGGMMAKGGKIKNQYEGRTASEVWEMWSEKQKSHFLLDHSELLDKDRIENNLGYSRIVQKDMSYSDLTPMTKRVLQAHIQDGQYADGGMMAKGGKLKVGGEDFSFLLELSDNELSKRLDLVRKQKNINAKQYFSAREKGESTTKIEESGNNLDNQERAIIEARIRKNKMADGGAIQSINGTQFSTEDLSGMFLKGGMLNKKVNEKIKAYLDDSSASPMHQWEVKTILESALTDANFHKEAKMVDSVFPNATFTESVQFSKLQEDFLRDRLENMGREIASMSEYDGDEIINAIAFYVSMNMGRPLGQKVESLKNSMANGGVTKSMVMTSDGKPINVGDLVTVISKRNKQYRVKEINGNENVKVVYYDGSEYVTTTSNLKKFAFASSNMANGGVTNSMEDVNYLKGMSGLRASYLEEWANKNNVDLSKVANAIKTKKLKPMDLSTAVSGRDGNKYAKDIIQKYSHNKMERGGKSYSKGDSIDSAKRVASAMRSKMMSKKKN
tara:strand:+ start:11177 stop:14029 length:2853 start_codon:yes stop_codon:yes gene_type:complete